MLKDSRNYTELSSKVYLEVQINNKPRSSLNDPAALNTSSSDFEKWDNISVIM